MKNTAFNYMYRDGSNFKKRGVAIFADLPTEELERRLIAALSEGLYFIAHQVRVPEVFLWDPELDYGEEYPEELIETGRYKINDMDHVWHEFTDLKPTNWKPTDTRTLREFIADLEVTSVKAWDCHWRPEDRR